ncbi:HlyD family efflux transporter periplasmic adaptor subunit [Rhizobium deserti]|uniref:HlyD family efflux transporter periplasmic adaptor subunit n=1 Tax=Rhizobium deserti TaxID=2547961 RepID=A0A4R5UAA5_9HYPH|nr:HlyD family efflux transporter periplasmic adaptor subunit [Rhizobium deserti]TDK31726.1 HlyD family efflux transporter periplasmic adaptor subunit [Rhizobium deserti]
MKSLKVIVGLALVAVALFVIVEEQLAGASADAFINAQVTTLKAPIAGRLDLEQRPLGAQVKKGDPIGSIDDPLADDLRLLDLLREQDETQAEVIRLEQALAGLVRSIGQWQTRAAIYKQERRNQLQAEARSAGSLTDAAAARSKYADFGLRRSTRLSERGVTTGEALEQAQSLAELSRLELRNATEEAAETLIALSAADKGVFLGDGYNDSPYSEQRISELDVQRIELDAQLQARKAMLMAVGRRIAAERLRVNELSASSLESHVNGLLWTYLSASGETVQRGQNVLTLIDCDSAIVTLSVSESVYNRIGVGSSATFRLTGDGSTMAGTVIRLAGAGAASIYQNLAISPSEQHLQRFDVALDVPALREDPQLRCLVGRTGRAFFESRSMDWLRRLWG